MTTTTTNAFSQRIIDKVGGRSLRIAQAESSISKDTISRAQKGTVPDLEVTIKFCLWLGCDLQTALHELGIAEKLNLVGKLQLADGVYLTV